MLMTLASGSIADSIPEWVALLWCLFTLYLPAQCFPNSMEDDTVILCLLALYALLGLVMAVCCFRRRHRRSETFLYWVAPALIPAMGFAFLGGCNLLSNYGHPACLTLGPCLLASVFLLPLAAWLVPIRKTPPKEMA